MSESFLDVDTSDAVEPIAVPDGEYQIAIIGFRKDRDGNIIRTDKNGGKFFMPLFEIPSEIAAKSFSMFVRIPDESNPDKKALNSDKYNLQNFKDAFQVTGPINLEDLVGREAWAMLRKTESAEYGDGNEVRKFIAGA